MWSRERKIEMYIIISCLASPGPGQRNNYFWLFIDRRLGGSFVCGNVFPMFGSLYFAHISSGEKIKIFSYKTNWLFVPKRSSKSVLFHFSSQFESLKENTVFFSVVLVFIIYYFNSFFIQQEKVVYQTACFNVSYEWWYPLTTIITVPSSLMDILREKLNYHNQHKAH